MKFVVKYLSPEGRPTESEMEASDRDEVLGQCRSQNWVVLDLKVKDVAAKKSSLRRGWEPFGIRAGVLAFFTRQLAELTEAGIPLVQTLETLQSFSTSGKMQDVIAAVIADISRGKGFAASLAAHPSVFNKIYISTVEVGEKTGNLAGMLNRLAEYQEKDEEVRSKLKSALTYPVFILVFCLVLTYGMVAYLLPGFTPMFTQSGLDLNKYPITQFLMFLSKLCTSFWDELLVGLLLFGLVATYRKIVSSSHGRNVRDSFLFRMPIFGEFIQLSINARVSQTLGILHEAGIPIYQAIAVASEISGNAVVENALNDVRSKVESGKGLSVAMAEHEDAFPPLLVQMIAVGERTGDVGKMLKRVSRYYEGQLDTSIKGFSALVEPVMMLFVGGIVGLFVMGVFLPIMGVVTALQAHI